MHHGSCFDQGSLNYNYQPSAHNHVVFLPDVDMSYETIYPVPAKKPLHLHNVEHQSFTQPIEGIHVPNPLSPDGPLVGHLRLPHRANTDATASTIAQRPQKCPRVLNDRELLVSLHQKQDRHDDWLSVRCKVFLLMSIAFKI